MNEQLKIIISAEIKELQEGVSKAKKEVQDFTKGNKEARDRVKDDFTNIGDSCKKGLAVAGGALIGGAGALLSLSKSTEDYRQNMAQLTAGFEQAGMSADGAKNIYKDLFGVMGDSDQAVESANNIALLADSEEEAAKWAELASGVLGTFHDTLQPEAFYEAANETMKMGEATGAFTQMLEQTGVMSVDEFNKKLSECTTEAEKQAFMLEVSNDAMGKAGDAYDEATESIQNQRKAQAELDDKLATLGETMSPILTAFTDMASIVIEQVSPAIQDFMDNHGDALAQTLSDIAEAIGDVISWIADNWDVIAPVAGVIGAIAVALGVFSTAMGIVNTVMAMSPVTLIIMGIVAAIAAIVAIIVVVIKHWDDIKEAVRKAVDFIKEKIDGFVQKFKDMKENITNKIKETKDNIVNKFTEIKDGISNKIEEIKTKVKTKFDEVKKKITQPVEDAKTAVKNVIDKIKGFFNFTWSLPKLKVPKFGITPEGWKVGDLLKGSIPKLSVQWNARGGVFDSPTLFGYGNSLQGIGEAGAEAVVPLENNLEWLDKLASMLDARLANRQPTILMVDKKVLGQVTAESINDITRQTGNMPLVVV